MQTDTPQIDQDNNFSTDTFAPQPNPSDTSQTKEPLPEVKKPYKFHSKSVATILGILFLVSGIAVGVGLVNQNQEVRVGAFECINYTFVVTPEGEVIVSNGSRHTMKAQTATIYINDEEVGEFEVPLIEPGTADVIGLVKTPPNSFTWKVVGSIDCEGEGAF